MDKDRGKIIDDIVKFFKSDFWNDVLKKHLEDIERDIWHTHIYMDSSINPKPLTEILEGYFYKTRNLKLLRNIDFLSNNPTKVTMLHNCHFESLPHFDVMCTFNSDEIIKGKKVESWGKEEVNNFYANFQFKAVGPKQESQIRDFFKSKYWKDGLKNIMNSDVIHLHFNVRINFDPKILEMIAKEVLASQGWTIDKVVPCIFTSKIRNNKEMAKLVFLGSWPERVYDIAWDYDENVVIAPANENWVRAEKPPVGFEGFDWRFISEFEAQVKSENYLDLTREEIDRIISEF